MPIFKYNKCYSNDTIPQLLDLGDTIYSTSSYGMYIMKIIEIESHSITCQDIGTNGFSYWMRNSIIFKNKEEAEKQFTIEQLRK